MWAWISKGDKVEIWEVERFYDTVEDAVRDACRKKLVVEKIVNAEGKAIYQRPTQEPCSRGDYL